MKDFIFCAGVGELDILEFNIEMLDFLRVCWCSKFRVICQRFNAADGKFCLVYGLAQVHAAHDALRENGGHENVEHQIDDCCGDVAGTRCNKECRGDENEGDAVDERRVRAHDEFPAAGICSDHLMVIINRFIEILEGENGLLEDFHNGDAAHVFDRFCIHVFERLHVFLHKVLALVHLGAERDDGVGNWDEGGDAKTPIENEQQYERGDGNDDGPC